jgi:hypothetical protein
LITDFYQSLSNNTGKSTSKFISTYYSSLTKYIKNFKDNIERFLSYINKIKSINNNKQITKIKTYNFKDDSIYSEI